MTELKRYGVITKKLPREIVLLRGSGCRWKKCTFCDYHLDASNDETANFELNREALANITGAFGRLEIINSGSFTELDTETLRLIRDTASEKGIGELHFECHWMYRSRLAEFTAFFAERGIRVIYKIGVESFDTELRERVLNKGLGDATPEQIAAAGFGEVNLLCGFEGQTAACAKNDIRIALKHFDRVCVNFMTENTTRIRPCKELSEELAKSICSMYGDDERVDILLNNTDFGVG